MIESISDAIQLLALVVCFTISVLRAFSTRSTTWLMVTCFFSCMLLGNAYWFGYLLVFGETPIYSYIADLGWLAGYVFLFMLELDSDQRRVVSAPIYIAWLPVVICAVCCVYYIAISGSPLLNIADNSLLAAIGFFAMRGIAAGSGEQSGKESVEDGLAYNRPFHVVILTFVAVEQVLWLSSSLLVPGPIASMNPYIAMSFALTISYVTILICAMRRSAS